MSEAEEEEIQRLKARVGTTLHGKWRIDALIGAGGMAAVYAATHHVGHRVAIKILHPEGAVSRELRARFEQEALAAARLGHPAAVQVHDIDVTERGEPFLVMELLDGESLRERVLRLGTISLTELLAHMDTLLEVIKAAHDAGIVHRDIKPDNLFVTRDGRLKVLDFGIARMKQGGSGLKTRTGAVLGTTSYMAPEQILGRNVDGRADLYAVGATMFTVLANRRVHDDDGLTEGELLVKRGTTPAPPLLTVAPGVDPRVARVVDRALAFQLERRYPDAQTMLADVRAVRRGEEPPFATGDLARMDERTRAYGRAIPDGPPVGAQYPSASPPAGVMPAAVAASTGAPPGQPYPGAAGAAPRGRGQRAPGATQIAVVGGVAVLLFCVGVGMVLLLWPSRDQGAGDAGDSGAPVSLQDVAQARSAAVLAVDPAGCPPGAPCTCPGGSPGKAPASCLLTCGDAPGCRPSCSDRESCASHCAGDCQSSCAKSKVCSTTCADGCSTDCRNAETCQVTCGAGCSITCEDVNKCAHVVGDRSVVRCNRVGGCQVMCMGSCAVSCSNTGGGCPVTCVGQGPAVKCGDGRKACGDGCALPR